MRNLLQYSIEYPLGITSFNGINIPWLQFETAGEVKHDGYGNGFDNTYFNGTNGNSSLISQLDALKAANVKYIRLWLNIYHYMNADKETVGYTAFRSGFLTNLATYADWCEARGIKMLICLDDCWYTFPWEWLSNASKKASYIQACKDVVTALKDKPAVWGWDYCNEPYMGWSWSNVDSTIHNHKGNPTNELGYTRVTLTNFFKDLYIALKAIAPTHLFSVGSTTPGNRDSMDLSRWDIASAVDFYQLHWYGKDPELFTYKASDYDKPVIIGEYGYQASNNVFNYDFMMRMLNKFIQNGFVMVMPWSFSQMFQRTGTATYTMPQKFTQQRLWQE